MITAKIVGDSINEHGGRITTMEVVFPRIILAEFNTHRAFSRNSASSRAIPYKKLLKSVIEDPFIPIAFQKDHSGMQGKEYLDMDKQYDFYEIQTVLIDLLLATFKDDPKIMSQMRDVLNQTLFPLIRFDETVLTIRGWWLKIRDLVVASSLLLHAMGVTKQICNRLLEVFIKNHKVLVTSTEWDNFFALRCPQYIPGGMFTATRSKKDYVKMWHNPNIKLDTKEDIDNYIKSIGNDLTWLKLNEGQAEIHMMALAEAMWDAYNESTPKLLKTGEWHIPYREHKAEDGLQEYLHEYYKIPFDPKIDTAWKVNFDQFEKFMVKVATVRAARTSYTVVGEDQKLLTYEKMIEIHDKLISAKPVHASPTEHCAQVMDRDDYSKLSVWHDEWVQYGVSRNFTGGWKQYRQILGI